VKSKAIRSFLCVLLASLLLAASSAQTAKPAFVYPSRLPYSFGNFVWWSNDELRALLKKRIPGLGDQIATTHAAEDQMRNALQAILKEKGIAAEVQSQEPSEFSLTAERDPEADAPTIGFFILSPQILIDKVVFTGAPESIATSLSENLRRREGHEYSAGQNWLVQSNAQEELIPKSYLEGKVVISHDAPRHVGDHYVVNLLVTVDAGPQYRISSITADGGPLLVGRDLSPYFSLKVGDLAGYGPFGKLAGDLRPLYWHWGYADVVVQGPPVLDHEHALVSYHLDVIPGHYCPV
jgi:hypothetical protein